ncbi:beta strand repeat-containing protein [Myroides fluvii]|uniref:beta strand repeat-containing protein n=1 Tax=Myroides fluvii TaxID=2572594 RepID=UPI00131BB486|nr:hypothetical protein [Myroides fluvii]
MKKRWILLGAFCTGAVSYAQVGIGTTTPNPSSQLEISSDKRGVLIPQITLKNLTDDITIDNGNVESLLVYNITSDGVLIPGYYFWKNGAWNRLLTELEGKEWSGTKNKSFIVENGLLKLYDENDDFVSIDVEKLNIVTTLIKDVSGNGKYTYTNEVGDEVIIDVKGDVIHNFQEIINNTEVQEIINTIVKNVGGNVYFDGNSFTYLKPDGTTETINISTLVKANETITTLVKDASGNGQYTYKNEAGNAVMIDVQADVINNFEDILNNTDVQEILNTIINTVGGNVHYDGTSFTYVDATGTHTIDLGPIIKANETITTLVKDASGNGQYTYKNEAGNAVVIDVQADVINNFEDILNNTDVQEILNTIINTVGGNVHYDGTSFTYVDATGTHTIDLGPIIKANETITTLVKDASGNGQYTYKNEAGNAVVIDVQADVINNFEDIVNNTDVQEILNTIINTVGGNVHYDGTSFTYVDATGTHTIDLGPIIKANETITTLVKDPSGNGQYTYKNEAGNAVVIDVQADVINNFEDIVNNTDVQEILNTIINTVGGNVYYDGTSFTYVDATGTHTIDLGPIIKANETITTLVKDASGNGQYTYKNEAGNAVMIDVQADVINNFEDILNNTDVQEILNTIINTVGGNVHYDGTSFTYVDATGTHTIDLGPIIKANETITTLVKDASGNGQYTYKNEAGNAVVIDVPADVIQNFETIIGDTNVENLLKQFITVNGGGVQFDGNAFTYLDANEVPVTVTVETLVKDHETLTTLANVNGVLTYTNEGNTAVTVDIPALVKDKETVTTFTNVNDVFTYTSEDNTATQLNIPALVKANETETTLVKDASGNGKYTYNNEKGIPVVIDIPADVIQNFETIIGDTNVENLLKQFITVNGGGVQFDGNAFTYLDANEVPVTVTVETLVKDHETVTTLANVNGVLTYTNEGNTAVTVDIPALVKDKETVTTLANASGVLTYTNEANTAVTVDIPALVKANETETTLVKDALGNGKYTYNNEKGTPVVIDIPADVIQNFETIIGDTNVENLLKQFITVNGGGVQFDGNAFTYLDANEVPVTVTVETLVKDHETLTTLANVNGVLTYTNEGNTAVTVDIPALVKDKETVTTFTNVNDVFTYTSEDNTATQLNIPALVKANETETTLVKDASGNGKYTYNNEKGIPVVIDIPADVIQNFETIIGDTNVENLLKQFITVNGGGVQFDGNAFTYLDANEDPVTVTVETLVKDHETLTTLANVNGVLTYTNEGNTAVTVDIPALVKANETETTLVKDASGNGKYTYNNEKGIPVVIDIPADVIQNFETIIGDTNVENLLKQFITVNGGGVQFDGNAFTYLDANEDPVTVTVETLVKDHETLTTLANVNGVLTYTNEGNTAVSVDIPALVKANETETTLVKDALGNGKYTYNNEKGTPVVIDIPADVIQNFETIIGDTNVENLLKQFITVNGGGVQFDGNAFTYLDANEDPVTVTVETLVKDHETLTTLANVNGVLTYTNEGNTAVSVDIPALVKANETETTLVKDALGNGKYTYNNEKGTPVVIDIPADVIQNFETIIGDTNVENLLKQFITVNGGGVQFDGNAFTYLDANEDPVTVTVETLVKDHETLTTLANVNGVLTYTNEGNTAVSVDIPALVKANETETTLVKDALGNGKYTYNNEKGTPVVIDIPADVIQNFETIIGDTNVENLLKQFITVNGGGVQFDGNAFTYLDANEDPVTVTVETLVKDHETVTTLANVNGVLTYTNEGNTAVSVDIPALVKDKETVTTFTNVNSVFTYTSEDNTTTQLNIPTLVKANETETTLVKDASGNGKYTYNNEKGIPVVIDIPADVIQNFETIIGDTNVENLLKQFITVNGGGVQFDGNAFTYLDANEDPVTVTVETLVKDHETLTTLANVNGVLTYTNEGNTAVSVDIPALVKANETETTLVKDASGNGKYTYNNEKGTPVVIDIPADVIQNFETIIGDTNVENLLKQFITVNGGGVQFDGNAFTYLDANEDPVTVTVETLVKDHETLTTLANVNGVLTYTNEGNTAVTVDIPALVKDKETVTTFTNVNSVFTYTSEDNTATQLNIPALVKANETETTLVKDASGNGKYTYNNEKGIPVVIDIPADVIQNFETIIGDTNVENLLKQFITVNGGGVQFDGNAFTYLDANEDPVTVTVETLVKDHETLTTLANVNGVLTYTNEGNTAVTVDIPALVKANETETTLVKDASGNGKYTYNNEKGIPVVIDIPADVIQNFETIIGDTNVENLLKQFITVNGGGVQFDGNAFTYLDANEDPVTVTVETLVKDHETLTTLANVNGVLTYTNEGNTAVTVDIPALVKANETETTLVKDASGNGKYTYNNEKGTPVVINIPADVIQNFETIIENTNVENLLKQFITVNGYVKFDGEYFTYIDGNGQSVMVNIGDLVRMHETVTTLANVNGVLTYTNEGNTAVSVDIPALVKDKETVTTFTNVNSVFTYTSEDNTATQLNIPTLVKANETLTVLENIVTQESEESGEIVDIYTLTYKDEAGDLHPIDIKVLVKGTETLTTLVYDPAAHILTYTNEKGEKTVLELTDLVGGSESLTKLEFDANTNSLLFTDEEQIIHTVDLESINKHPWYDSATQKIATSNTANIYTKGWVGIGFTEPSNAPSEKLRVNGSITAVNSYYADYVFENYFDGYSALKYDYNFKSLDVVEEFIKTNRHLPGITPIHELNKTEEGYAINVSELSIQLLEKTEELYLHVIDQNKELEEKEARIKELEQANQDILQKVDRLELMLQEFMQKN